MGMGGEKSRAEPAHPSRCGGGCRIGGIAEMKEMLEFSAAHKCFPQVWVLGAVGRVRTGRVPGTGVGDE